MNSFSLHASILKLETSYGKIFIPEKKGWELGKNMFGMPFIYFSPQTNGQRSNISFTYTGVTLEINLAELSKDPDAYKKIKENWAKTVHAKPLVFLPFKKWKNAQGHAVHEIGFEYIHENKTYQEKSFYISCRDQLVFAKSLRLKINEGHDLSFNELLSQLDCGKNDK
jgi:hypothetical protein